jgi:replicative DNA helicase
MLGQARQGYNRDREPDVDLQLHNVTGEAALLGALLVRNTYADNVADILEPEDFFEPIHGAIYAALIEGVSAGRTVSPVTLLPIFANDARFQELGGTGYLARLTESSAVLLIDVKSQASDIAELAARRRLIDSLDETRGRVSRLDLSLLQLVDEADAGLVAAVERRETVAQPTISEAMGLMLERISAIQANDGKVGTQCGISDIDRLVGGFDAGQLIILAGRPGMGKTAVACGMAKGLAQSGAGVLFVSLEMGSVELAQRVASDLCFTGRHGIPFERIVNATVSAEELRYLARATSEADSLPLRIVDAGSVSMARLALSIRRHKRRFKAKSHDLKVVIIDYLQLLQASKNAKSPYEQVSEISKGLKALAKDNELCIIALAQLSRAVEQREDKRPVLSDLRDSGQIEQDADAVMFLFREEYYLAAKKPKREDMMPDWERSMRECEDRIDFILAKRRNGRTGHRTGWYHSRFQAVRGADDRQDEML